MNLREDVLIGKSGTFIFNLNNGDKYVLSLNKKILFNIEDTSKKLYIDNYDNDGKINFSTTEYNIKSITLIKNNNLVEKYSFEDTLCLKKGDKVLAITNEGYEVRAYYIGKDLDYPNYDLISYSDPSDQFVQLYAPIIQAIVIKKYEGDDM